MEIIAYLGITLSHLVEWISDRKERKRKAIEKKKLREVLPDTYRVKGIRKRR